MSQPLSSRSSTTSLRLHAEWRATLGAMYPPTIAIEIARQLSADIGASETDVRVAQLSPADVLAELPDPLNDPIGASNRIVGAVTAKRTRRMTAVVAASTARLTAERDDSKAEAASHAKLVLQERQARLEAEGRLHDKDIELRRLSRQRESDAVCAARRERMRWVTIIGVIVVAALVFFQFYWFATGTVATLVVMRVRGRDWVENKDLAWTAWASAALPEFLGIIEFFRR